MNKTKLTQFVLRFVCVLAIAAMALCTFGCETKDNTKPDTGASEKNDVTDPDNHSPEATGVKKVGIGETSFEFEVTDGDGNVTKFLVATDKKTVGEALKDAELIEGEEGPYGLYVKKVNDIEADYDKDRTYWAFYIDGETAMTGVDKTDIKEGSVYSFKVEK